MKICFDLVTCASGAMNPEATVSSTPVYTQFQGWIGGVDGYLIKQGQMVRVVDNADIPSMEICRKRPADSEPWKQDADLMIDVVDKTLSSVWQGKKQA